MKFLMAVSLGVFSLSLFAAQRPALPGPVADEQFDDGSGKLESAITVIQRHQQNQSCKKDLNETWSRYTQAKNELHKRFAAKASSSAIDEAEADMVDVRKELLPLVETCGPCVTRVVKKPILVLNRAERRTEAWWAADGSCQLTGTKAQLGDAYKSITNSLLHYHQYAKHPIDPNVANDDGGFHYVLQFFQVDHEKGVPHPEIDEMKNPPVYAWVMVPGFPWLNSLYSFYYYFRNDWSNVNVPGHGNSLYMTFNRRTTPDGDDGIAPEIPAGLEEKILNDFPASYPTASGATRVPTKPHKLHRVMGSWLITEDGYLRYFTAADFGALGRIPGIPGKFAHDILLDTIVQTAERTHLELK